VLNTVSHFELHTTSVAYAVVGKHDVTQKPEVHNILQRHQRRTK